MKQFTLFLTGLFLLSYSSNGQANKAKVEPTTTTDPHTVAAKAAAAAAGHASGKRAKPRTATAEPRPVTPKPAPVRRATPVETTPAVPKAPFVKASEERCVEVIRKVFKDYLQLEEGITDPHEKKILMQKAIRTLPETLNKAELPLLINVWMYYDPGDIAVRNLFWPIFMKNKAIILEAIDYRIKHREKWERIDTPPFTDLISLQKRLSYDD